jgi:hypothetical protein
MARNFPFVNGSSAKSFIDAVNRELTKTGKPLGFEMKVLVEGQDPSVAIESFDKFERQCFISIVMPVSDGAVSLAKIINSLYDSDNEAATPLRKVLEDERKKMKIERK